MELQQLAGSLPVMFCYCLVLFKLLTFRVLSRTGWEVLPKRPPSVCLPDWHGDRGVFSQVILSFLPFRAQS